METSAAARETREREQEIQPVAALLAGLLFSGSLFAQALPGSQRVEFEVATPSGALKIAAHAFTPPPVPEGTRVPGVVILHGSEGITDSREGFWGRELAQLGVVALVVDSFTPRKVKSTVDDQTRVSTGQMIGDAMGALDFLSQQPFIDPKRIALMGMSKGGGAVLLASDQRTQQPGMAFSAYISLYPACQSQYRNPRSVAPMLMLLGEADDYTGFKPCADYAERMRKAGGKVELKAYKGAPHGFDGEGAPAKLAAAQNFSDCMMTIEDDGRTIFAKTGAALGSSQVVIDTLKRECMKTGATIGGNAAARKQALADVTAFLKSTLVK
jgi:dienelactone hydrolase